MVEDSGRNGRFDSLTGEEPVFVSAVKGELTPALERVSNGSTDGPDLLGPVALPERVLFQTMGDGTQDRTIAAVKTGRVSVSFSSKGVVSSVPSRGCTSGMGVMNPQASEEPDDLLDRSERSGTG